MSNQAGVKVPYEPPDETEEVRVDEIEVADATEPEMSDFGRVTTLLMDSFSKGRGRTFGKAQVAVLAEGLLDMAATIQGGIAYTEQLEEQLEETKGQKRIWRPNK